MPYVGEFEKQKKKIDKKKSHTRKTTFLFYRMSALKVAPFVAAAAAAYAGKTKKRGGGEEFWGCCLGRRDVSSSLSSSSRRRRRFHNDRRGVHSTGASSSSMRDDSDDKNVFDAFSQMKTKKKKKEADDEETKTSSNWRPAPPDISSSAPREFSPISYALLGDSVWELFVRSYLFAPRSKPSTYDSKVKKLARAESQAYAYRKITEIQLTDEELDVCKWGRNADYSNVPKRLRGKKSQGGGHDIYRQASALEVILGWWMVTDDERLDEVLERVKTSGWLEDALTSVEYGSEEEEED
jgi:ribonuclease-3 family protein